MSDTKTANHSPLPIQAFKPAPALTFPQAMEAVARGERLTKLEWNDRDTYIHLSEGHLKIHKSDGGNFDLIVSDGDLTGTDWLVR